MYQPVAARKGAGIVANDGEHEEGPGQEERVAGKGAAHAQSAKQAEGVPGYEDGGYEARGREAVIQRRLGEYIDSPDGQPEQHERERDGAAELFQAAPTQAADEEK